jgi:hypothetical protein
VLAAGLQALRQYQAVLECTLAEAAVRAQDGPQQPAADAAAEAAAPA